MVTGWFAPEDAATAGVGPPEASWGGACLQMINVGLLKVRRGPRWRSLLTAVTWWTGSQQATDGASLVSPELLLPPTLLRFKC